ncbi:MAG: hypothetical protein JWN26_708 [Candidatus Saccharibacteria bacterium]|nr:hypothetical protein [Candidatus Saccharibacteria bacterium]
MITLKNVKERVGETMQDIITKEITVKAPKERVYQAITDPKQITKWFPDEIEGMLEVGQQSIVTFNGYGKSSLLVIDANPFDYFAYRWIPGGSSIIDDLTTVQTTLVEFHLTEQNGRTKVVLTESGFATLPADVAAKSFSDNSGGWDQMMSRLEKMLSQD